MYIKCYLQWYIGITVFYYEAFVVISFFIDNTDWNSKIINI